MKANVFMLTALLFTATACATIFHEPSVEPYLMRYEAETGKTTTGVSVYFGTTTFVDGSTSLHNLACYYAGLVEPWIIVDKQQWTKLNDAERMWLISHEIGHHEGLTHTAAGRMQPSLPRNLR